MPVSLTDEELATLKRLKTKLDKSVNGCIVNGQRRLGFKVLKTYYEGQQKLVQLGIAVPDALRDFVTIIDWPGTYVDTIVSRLRPQGFLLAGDVDETMWKYWQANDLDTEIRMAFVDMLVYGRGYLCEGTNEEDDSVPLITVESPFQMIHEWSNRHRKITAAARFFTEEVNGKHEQRATLYLPNKTMWLGKEGRNGWVEIEEADEHELGRVPVQALVNRSSSDDRYGQSEMLRIIPLTDAACRALTNAQIATEIVALPQKWAAGLTQADFKDPKTGEQIAAFEAYIGAIWASGNKDAKFGQFSAADLANFKTIVGLYAQLVSGSTGLPMRYLGQLSDNPPSADGIRADESRIIGTAEEKQSFADGPLEYAMRTGDFIVTGVEDDKLKALETSWRSAATPTLAQAADAALKLYAGHIISLKQARRDMGYTPVQITQMEEQDAIERELQQDPTLNLIANGLVNAGSGSA